MKHAIKLTVLFILIFSFSDMKAKTIRIPDEYPTIQSGIDAANKGDTVLVADGIYLSQGNNKEVIDFNGKAIVVKSENGPDKCILSQACYIAVFQSGEGNGSVLSGFTLAGADPGAAIYCKNSSPVIKNNIVTNNWSEYGEGAVYLDNSSAIFMNNVFFDNRVHGDCAGIVCSNNSKPFVVNNTFFGHDSGELFNAATGILCDHSSTAEITNTIFWNTGILDFKNCTITYSCIDKQIVGTGNINVYPEFKNVNTLGFQFGVYENSIKSNFSLQGNSACVNSGSPAKANVIPQVDALGKQRIMDQRIDMGAYEYSGEEIIAYK